MGKLIRVFVATMLLGAVGLVQAQYSGSDYGVGAVRQMQNVQSGIVADVLPAQLAEDPSTSSRVIGAAAGAAVCGQLAQRSSSNWTTQAAAMALCGALGERITSQVAASQVRAQTIVVRMDNGQMLAVVQQDPYIQRGERVYVFTGNGGTRIVRAGV